MTDCSICAEPLESALTVTRCGHVFHESCLLEWFQHKPVCPLCKTERSSGFERPLLAAPAACSAEAAVAIEASIERGDEPPCVRSAAAAVRLAVRQESKAHAEAAAARSAVEREQAVLASLRAEHRRLGGRLQARAVEALNKEREVAALSASVQRGSVGAGGADVAAAAAAAAGRNSAAAKVAGGEAPAVTRERLASLSQQVGWRSGELKDLRAKVEAARATLVADRSVPISLPTVHQ